MSQTREYLFLQTTTYHSIPPITYEAGRIYNLTADMIDRWNRRGVGTDDVALIQAAKNSLPPEEALAEDAAYSIQRHPDIDSRWNVVDKSGKAINDKPLTLASAGKYLEALGRGETAPGAAGAQGADDKSADGGADPAQHSGGNTGDGDAAGDATNEDDWQDPLTAAAVIKLAPEVGETGDVWLKGRKADGTITRTAKREEAAVAESVQVANAWLGELRIAGEVQALDHARAWLLVHPQAVEPNYLRHVPARPDATPPVPARISLVTDPTKASRYGSEAAALNAAGNGDVVKATRVKLVPQYTEIKLH